MALGVAFSSGYRVDQQVRIDFNHSATFQGYTLTPVDRFLDRSASRISSGAVVQVSRGGRQIATLRPRTNVFGSSQQPVSKPAVMYTFTHDLYLNLDNTIGPDTTYVVLRAIYSPLVSWIWFGGLLFVVGVATSLMPARRRLDERRTVTAGARAAGGAAGAAGDSPEEAAEG
ncbi:MAG: cytochrome c-type biogenesis CcmF C-terminal domain-containing protein [Deinococcales bacterium]